VLYKAKNIEKCQKLAKLEGYIEAVLETRGKGGYVVLYRDGQMSPGSYLDIAYITDEERNIIIDISKGYDFKDSSPIVPIKKNKAVDPNIDHSTKNYSWADYNNRTDVWDLIQNEFDLIQDTNNTMVIKRHGTEHDWSGYIYKDSGCMFLFTDSTIYPSRTLLSPFQVLAYQKYNGDKVETARQLYFEGYGDRIEPDVEKPKKKQYRRKYFFSEEVFKKTLTGHQDNSFLNYLEKKDIPEEQITGIIEDYYLGT